jgi:DNA-binding PadR family transcriptional regulator
MLKIHLFWQAKHSQIYPLLAELEKDGHVQFELVEQTNKPDKKVYSITNTGEAAVRQWLSEPTADPITRDEFTLKLYCIWISDPDTAKKLLADRTAMYEAKLTKLENRMEQLRVIVGGDLGAITLHSPYFGAYTLVQRGIMYTRTNIEWCGWVTRTWLS